MSRQIFWILSLVLIFLTIIPQICLTFDQQPELAESSESAEPALIKPYISDYKRISKKFLGHLFPFDSWFLKSRLQRPLGYARPAYVKVGNFQRVFFCLSFERKKEILQDSTAYILHSVLRLDATHKKRWMEKLFKFKKFSIK